jgi:hypothetical protein
VNQIASLAKGEQKYGCLITVRSRSLCTKVNIGARPHSFDLEELGNRAGIAMGTEAEAKNAWPN